MPQNYFITGLPKAGKTVLLRRLIKALKSHGLKVGGLISPEEAHHGTRTGFYVKDIGTGRIARLADVDADGPKVSKYHVDVKSFESVAVPVMEGFERYDVMVIDEVGPMELKSARFAELLDRILDSDTPLIASLHQDYAPRYAVNGDVILLAENNREAVYDELLEDIKSIGKRAPKAKARPAKAAAKKEAPKKPAKAKEKKAKAAPEKKKTKRETAPLKKAERPKPPQKKPEEKKEAKAGKKEVKGKKGLFQHLKELLHS